MRRRGLPGRAAVSVALLVAVAACARRPAAGEDEDRVVYRAERSITITIVNHSQVDAIVYLAHDGVRDRLGAVSAATTVHFPVRGRQLASGTFSLLADPVGGRRATSTETLSVAQGTSFSWTLETNFERGAVIVRE